MHDVRARGPQGRAAGKRQDREPLDDWLGDISDDDWNEDAADLAGQERATPLRQEHRAPEDYAERDVRAGRQAQAGTVTAADARRGAVERRRFVAAVVGLLLVGLGALTGVLLQRDGGETPVTTAADSTTVTTPAGTETDPLATTPSTTPTTTTPSESPVTFTLPEGTKLQRGEAVGESDLTVSTDPELITELQRALAEAGFDPGTADGSFGQNTEAAVVAFQQANGLPLDGIVGPETAAALNSAIAGG